MPTIVNVLGVGEIEFPDSMSDSEIEEQLRQKSWEQPAPEPQWQMPITPPSNIPGGMTPEEVAMTQIRPLGQTSPPIGQYIGKALGAAGRAGLAAITDAPEALRSLFVNSYELRYGRTQPEVAEPMRNLAAVSRGEEMPAVSEAKVLPWQLRGLLRFSQGAIQTAPNLGAMAALTPIIGPYGAGAAAFGFTEEGFDAKSAAIGAGLPFAGRVLGGASGQVMYKLSKHPSLGKYMESAGLSSYQARNFVRGVAGTVGPAGLLAAEQLHSIEKLRKDGTINESEAADAEFDVWSNLGGSIGLGPIGVKFEKRPPPIIPVRTKAAATGKIWDSHLLSELERSYLEAEYEGQTINVLPSEVGPKQVIMRPGMKPGEIDVFAGELQRWLEQIPEGSRGRAVSLALSEERIHMNTPRELGKIVFDLLSPVQRSIFRRVYGDKVIDDTNLGLEAIRILLQRMGREGPREVAEATLRERWTVQALLAMNDVIGLAIEKLGGQGGSKVVEQQRAILWKVQQNMKVAQETAEAGKVPPSVAARNKQQLELPYDELTKAYLATARAAMVDPDKFVKETQPELFGATERTTDARPVTQAAEVYGDLQPPPGPGGRQMSLEEGRTGVQPQAEAGVPKKVGWSAENDPNRDAYAFRKTQREFKDDAEVFARANKVDDPEGFGQALGNYLSGGRQANDQSQALFQKFVAEHPEYGRMTEGRESFPAAFRKRRNINYDGPGIIGNVVQGSVNARKTDNLLKGHWEFRGIAEGSKRWRYDPDSGTVTWVFKPNAESMDAVDNYLHKSGITPERHEPLLSGGDAFVPAFRTAGEFQGEGPAARRKSVPGELQPGLDFLGRTGAPQPQEPTAKQTGLAFKQISPEILEQAIKEHIKTADDPTFAGLSGARVQIPGRPGGPKLEFTIPMGGKGFAEIAGERWNVSNDQVRTAWRGALFDSLIEADNSRINYLLQRLDLGRSENRLAKGMGAVPIPEGLKDEIKQGFLDFQGQPGTLSRTINSAINRATSAKHREQDYKALLEAAKNVHGQLAELGFEDISKSGELLRGDPSAVGGAGPNPFRYKAGSAQRRGVIPEENEQSRGLARKLLTYRTKMDRILQPPQEAVKSSALTRERNRLVKEIAASTPKVETVTPLLPGVAEPAKSKPATAGSARAGILRKKLDEVDAKIAAQGGQLMKEADEISPLSFQPTAPAKGKKFGPSERRRLRAITEVAMELMKESETPGASLNRKKITPEDLAIHRGRDAVRKIDPVEAENVGLLGAILTAAPEMDKTTITRKVLDRKRVVIRRTAPQEAVTRNLVAVEDLVTHEVKLLSVYEGSDGTVRIYEPAIRSDKRNHVPLSPQWLNRYKPLYALQLDAPVREFFQKFPSKDAFRREITSPARELRESQARSEDIQRIATLEQITEAKARAQAARDMGEISEEVFDEQMAELDSRLALEESGVTQKPKEYSQAGGLIERTLQGRSRGPGLPPERLVTESEASAIWTLTKGLKGALPTQESVLTLLNDAPTDVGTETLSPKARLALLALQKIETQLNERSDAGGPVSREAIANQVVNAAQGGREMFRDIMVRRFGQSEAPPERLEAIGSRSQGLESAQREVTIRTPEELARENEARRKAGLRPATIERRGGGTGRPEPVALRPGSEMLPPEQQAALEAKIPKRQEYEGDVSKTAFASPELYKYLMSGWPKFESLGDTPISVFDSPAAFRKFVQKSAETINYSLLDPTGGILRGYSGWMSQRLREHGGARANEVADIFDHVIDRTKGHEGELFAQFGDEAMKAVSGKLGTLMNGFKVVDPRLAPDAAIGNGQGMVEGWMPSPAWAQPGLQKFKNANLAAGQLVETVVPGFMANGLWERHLTPLGYDVITAGDGPLWNAFIQGEAVANGRTQASTARFYRLLKRTLDDPMPEAGRLDRMNQEIKRLFPRAVTHVQVPGRGFLGGWKQVRHANAFNYLNATLKRAAHMTAFREQFPIGGVGRTVLELFRDDILNRRYTSTVGATTSGNPITRVVRDPAVASRQGTNTQAVGENFDSLLRALQGHPTDQYGTSGMWGKGAFRPGDAHTEALRFANNTLMNLMAKAVLTRQYIVQIPELLSGATPGYLGYRNYIEGLARHRQLYPEMERTGTVNKVLYDWSIDPASKTQSLFRLAGNAISKLTAQNFLNEMQEASAAATAHVVGERIAANKLSQWEKRQLPATFKEMGFQPSQINQLMQGDPAMIDMFKRRAAAFLTSGNKHIAEGSRLGASRVFNSIFRFNTYPMMKANQLRQDFKLLLESKPGGNMGVAMERMARGLFFNTMQGAITAGLGAATASLISPDIKWREVKENPMRFILDSWFNAQGGPLYLMYSMAARTGLAGFGEQLQRMIFPWAIGREVVDYTTGQGRYKYMDANERTGTFLRSKLPGLGPVRLGISVAGLSNYDPNLDVARSALRRWMDEYYTAAGKPGESLIKAPLDLDFRKQMKVATDSLIRGEYEKYLEAVIQASGMKTPQAAATSLRGRKWLASDLILTSPKPNLEAIDDLIESIGDQAYQVLVNHDLMLENAADSLSQSED